MSFPDKLFLNSKSETLLRHGSRKSDARSGLGVMAGQGFLELGPVCFIFFFNLASTASPIKSEFFTLQQP